MKAIFLFIYKFMTAIGQAYMRQTEQPPARPSYLGVICSFEAHVAEKITSTACAPIRKHTVSPQPAAVPKRPAANPRTEWQIWCENNKMLFKNSA